MWRRLFRLTALVLAVVVYAGYSIYSFVRPPEGVTPPPAADWHNAAELFADDATYRPDIPKTWDDSDVESLELPRPQVEATPQQVSADYYYRIPVMPIYRSYPIYLPGREPDGYWEELRLVEPELVWDVRELTTKDDWIAAGAEVFRAPILWLPAGDPPLAVRALSGLGESVVDAQARWHERMRIPAPRDGSFPFTRIQIREKGRLEVGLFSCATCHTRVQPDGTVILGAQGNYPSPAAFPDAHAFLLRRLAKQLFRTPWVASDPAAAFDSMSTSEMFDVFAQTPPGVVARHGTSPWTPVQVPDLIGIEDRKYLDRTGLVRHRDIGDLMRYAALNQVTDVVASYDGYVPMTETIPFSEGAPPPESLIRYSDAQLYALALYTYSLTPPENPNLVDALTEKGRAIFEQEGCVVCHAPPLYTSNALTPVDGFTVPAEHWEELDIIDVRVGTDPRLSLQTRRGTGYYKVPSLRGVWYRGPFEHSGSVLTLEDWFDPARLGDDYVPTGFKGVDRDTRAVSGHPFALDLSAEERRALIAFLKTL